VISLAVAAAGWVGVSSPGDYAAIEFPPTPRHDPEPGGIYTCEPRMAQDILQAAARDLLSMQ
jgi:hypothetical protein